MRTARTSPRERVMRQISNGVAMTLAVLLVTWIAPAGAGTLRCPPDSVKVGDACIDLYEESVWQIPPSNTTLVRRVLSGRATLADLTSGGATQLSPAPSCSPFPPANFPQNGNWTPVAGSNPPSPGVYAVSIPGVPPSTCITWFQAAQACAVSGKHLVRNEEWQRAAAGTPDPGNADDGTTTCATNSAGPAKTGARSSCKSSWGTFDMVGNVREWVADWSDLASNCTDWTEHTPVVGALIAGHDLSCFGGAGNTSGSSGTFGNLPGALVRGGFWADGENAGVFAVDLAVDPPFAAFNFGFRCAR